MPTEGIRLVYDSGKCEIDLGRRELRVLGSPVPVGGRAFEIIEALAQSAGELVTKSELMKRIWPGAIVMDGTLHVHAAAVRKALGPYRGLLKTESRRGYRLLGDWTVRRYGPATSPAGFPERVTAETPATNFPLIVTRLVGRSAAVARLRDLVSAYRVVTITGPGGIGKTILALKVARRLLADFADGGWLVELASLSDPALVPSAVARVLGLKLGAEQISAETVARTIGGRTLLLVLDNCEHLIDAVATLAETLVRLCPRVTILATSREIFRIDGEHVYRVAPLEVPAPRQVGPHQILGHSAVELFVTRTKALDGADFSSRTENLEVIATICRHLDGIPLAIEFAAARAAALGIEQVAVALRDRFALLTSGRRNAVPRHGTLRATLDWSYDLLPAAEQLLLRRMAVFAGGFSLDAVTAVMSDTGLDASAIMNCATNLVTKSLVELDKSEAPTRWRLLETIRTYALEKLASHGEAEHVARRHAVYYRDYFVRRMSSYRSRWSTEDLNRYSREIDNVRAALDWTFSSVGEPVIGVELAAAYAPVWLNLSLMAECRERCEHALLSLQPDVTSNAWVQMWLEFAVGSTLVTTMGTVEQAKAALTRALELAESLDDLDMQVLGLASLVPILTFRGEFSKAWIALRRLTQIAQRSGASDVLAVADRFMGVMLLSGAGRPSEARECLERALQYPVTPERARGAFWYYSDNRAIARAMLARALLLLGFAEQGHAEATASLEELHGTGSALSVCRVIDYGVGRFALMTGNLVEADRAISLLMETATLSNNSYWLAEGRFLQGKLLVEHREFAKGAAMLREAFEACHRSGWRASRPEFEGALAEALAALGRLDDAFYTITRAIVSTDEHKDGQQWYVPELHRIRGEVLLRQDSDLCGLAAENSFQRAREIAREQGALFWELRAVLSLARLQMAQGRHDEARQILAPVYDRFTEGFGIDDLRAARAVLDTLQE
jgi:predicted ATPase/DNA-binding winged helix-turn-helix (wHTH) protein